MQPSVLTARTTGVAAGDGGFTLIELLVAMVIMAIATSGVALIVLTTFRSVNDSTTRSTETGEAQKIAQQLSTFLSGAQCVGTGSFTPPPTSTTIALNPTVSSTSTPMYSCQAASTAGVNQPGDNVVVFGNATAFAFWAPNPPSGCTSASISANTCVFNLYYVRTLPADTYVGSGTTVVAGTKGTCAAAGSFTGCQQLVVQNLTSGDATYLGNYVKSVTFTYYSTPSCTAVAGVANNSSGAATWNNSVLSVQMALTMQESSTAPSVPFTTCLYVPDALQ